LDEFLSENGIPVDGLPSSHLGHSTNIGGGGTNNRNDNLGHGLSLGLGPVTKRERSPSPSDCMSPDSMNNPPSPADSSKYREKNIFQRSHSVPNYNFLLNYHDKRNISYCLLTTRLVNFPFLH
jgi:hypothetical protein